MFPRPKITKEGKVMCSIHEKQQLKYIRQYVTPGSCPEIICQTCSKNSKKTNYLDEATFKSHSLNNILSATLKYVSTLFESNSTIVVGDQATIPIDYVNCMLQHVIQDYRVTGYGPRNLLYLSTQQILVTCSINGIVVFWKIDDSKVEVVDEFTVDGTIRCARQYNNETCLILAVDKYLYVYGFQEEKPGKFSFVNKIDCGVEINDIAIIDSQQKVAVVGLNNFVQLYNTNDFSLHSSIDTKSYGVYSPIYTVIYVEKENTLIVEDITGFYMFYLNERCEIGFNIRSYRLPKRNTFGLGYLPRSGKFVLRTEKNSIQIIDYEELSIQKLFPGSIESSNTPVFRFIANEDESQILSNTNSPEIAVYHLKDQTCYKIILRRMPIQNGSIETLWEQKKFVVGDYNSGIIMVFRVNTYPRYNQKVFVACSELDTLDQSTLSQKGKRVETENPDLMVQEVPKSPREEMVRNEQTARGRQGRRKISEQKEKQRGKNTSRSRSKEREDKKGTSRKLQTKSRSKERSPKRINVSESGEGGSKTRRD